MTGVREWAMERKESVGGKKTSEGEERIRREKNKEKDGGGEKRNRRTTKKDKKLAWANGSTKCSTRGPPGPKNYMICTKPGRR